MSVVRPFAVEPQRRDVYNLTVAGAHEFYANGILVHNCDSLRYLLINLGSGPEFVLLDELPSPAIVEELRPYIPHGPVAIIRGVDDPEPDEEALAARIVAQSPFV